MGMGLFALQIIKNVLLQFHDQYVASGNMHFVHTCQLIPKA